MWTFIVTPIVSLIVTVIFTAIDIAVRGGRVPIFSFAYDEEAEEEFTESSKKVEKYDDEEGVEA